MEYEKGGMERRVRVGRWVDELGRGMALSAAGVDVSLTRARCCGWRWW